MHLQQRLDFGSIKRTFLDSNLCAEQNTWGMLVNYRDERTSGLAGACRAHRTVWEPAMDVPFLLTLLMKNRTHSAGRLAWCGTVKWFADHGGSTLSLVFPHGKLGFQGDLPGVHLSSLQLWPIAKATRAEVDWYRCLANQLGAGKSKCLCANPGDLWFYGKLFASRKLV